MTGGSANQRSQQSVLARFAQLGAVEAELGEARERLSALESQLAAITRREDESAALRQELDVATHELDAQQRQFKASPAGSLLVRIDQARDEVANLRKRQGELEQQRAAIQARLAQAQRDAGEFASDRPAKLASLQVPNFYSSA